MNEIGGDSTFQGWFINDFDRGLYIDDVILYHIWGKDFAGIEILSVRAPYRAHLALSPRVTSCSGLSVASFHWKFRILLDHWIVISDLMAWTILSKALLEIPTPFTSYYQFARG